MLQISYLREFREEALQRLARRRGLKDAEHLVDCALLFDQ